MKEKWLLTFNNLGDVLLCLESESFRKKGVGVVVIIKMRHSMVAAARAFAVFLLRIITTGCPKRGTTNIDVEAKVEWLRSFMTIRSKVCLSDMDSLVAFGTQHARQCHITLL